MDALVIILTATILAWSNGLLGSFLILRKNIMIADAISHAVLPGLIIGFFIYESRNSLPVLISAALSGFICTLLIHGFSKSRVLSKDASTGFVFTFLFASGIILVSLFASNIDIDPDCVLHGELGYLVLENNLILFGIETLPVSSWNSLIVLTFLIGFLFTFWKPIVATSFDPVYAETLGYKSGKWDLVIMGITSFVTVISFEMIGAILVVAFMVLPSATAYLLTKKLKNLLLLTLALSAIECIVGYYVADYLDVTIASAIVSVMGIGFVMVFSSIQLSKLKLLNN